MTIKKKLQKKRNNLKLIGFEIKVYLFSGHLELEPDDKMENGGNNSFLNISKIPLIFDSMVKVHNWFERVKFGQRSRLRFWFSFDKKNDVNCPAQIVHRVGNSNKKSQFSCKTWTYGRSKEKPKNIFEHEKGVKKKKK